jgi:uncharacterized membrane protein
MVKLFYLSISIIFFIIALLLVYININLKEIIAWIVSLLFFILFITFLLLYQNEIANSKRHQRCNEKSSDNT